MTVRHSLLPDLVDSLSQDLQDQHGDDGVEYIVSFDTTLVKNLLTAILSLTFVLFLDFRPVHLGMHELLQE